MAAIPINPTPPRRSPRLFFTVAYVSATAPPITGMKLDTTYFAAFTPSVSAEAPTMLWRDRSPIKTVMIKPIINVTAFFSASVIPESLNPGFMASTIPIAMQTDRAGTIISPESCTVVCATSRTSIL